MAKRFIDTDLFKKRWIRQLSSDHKLFWIYLINSCNHAGIWEVDFEMAGFVLGSDFEGVSLKKAFGDKFVEISGGEKWFIPGFIEFQYGELNPANRAHNSVINVLKKYNLYEEIEGAYKPLISPLEGAKDKDKDMDKDKDTEKDTEKVKERGPRISKNSPPKEPDQQAYTEAVKLWNDHHLKVADHAIQWDKATGAKEGQALKKILKRILEITDRARETGSQNVSDDRSDAVISFWEGFLATWDNWDPFNKKPILTHIESRFTDIYTHLKELNNGKSKRAIPNKSGYQHNPEQARASIDKAMQERFGPRND